MKGAESGSRTDFNKRGRWCYTNNKTNMGIGNSKKISRSRILGIKEEPRESWEGCENKI